MGSRIPPGLVRCDVCGGFNGSTFEKYLARGPSAPDGTESDYQPDRTVSSCCRCHGPLCHGCGENRIPRPISTYYHEDINRILHVPYFAYARLCESCAARQELESLKETQASWSLLDQAVHVPREQRPGEASPSHIDVLMLSTKPLVSLTALVMMPTYASLLGGLPDPDSDAGLILQARDRARALWGDRPTHVIVPTYEYAIDAGRAHLRLPPVTYYAWLESDAIQGSTKLCSQLVVIWFGRLGGYSDLMEYVRNSLRSLPWDEVAGGCDPPGLAGEVTEPVPDPQVRRRRWYFAAATVLLKSIARSWKAGAVGCYKLIGSAQRPWLLR